MDYEKVKYVAVVVTIASWVIAAFAWLPWNYLVACTASAIWAFAAYHTNERPLLLLNIVLVVLCFASFVNFYFQT